MTWTNRLFFVMLSLVAGCVAMSTPTASTSSGLTDDLEPDTNRLGRDYRSFDMEVDDPALCKAECNKEAQCVAFTYVKPGWQGPAARCWLKNEVPTAGAHGCCVSGVKAP